MLVNEVLDLLLEFASHFTHLRRNDIAQHLVHGRNDGESIASARLILHEVLAVRNRNILGLANSLEEDGLSLVRGLSRETSRLLNLVVAVVAVISWDLRAETQRLVEESVGLLSRTSSDAHIFTLILGLLEALDGEHEPRRRLKVDVVIFHDVAELAI